MKCPYCSDEMKKGEVQIGDIIEARLKNGGPILWISEEDCKRILPKKTVRLESGAEGYYCEKCAKVVAFFDEKDAGFIQ